jgi:hypothetical protein
LAPEFPVSANKTRPQKAADRRRDQASEEKRDPESKPRARRPERRATRILSQVLSDTDGNSEEEYPSRRRYPDDVHRAVRITKRTHKAILFALEEALRGPYQFTPDLEEENADMADLRGGHEPAVSNGMASRRPAPETTGLPGGMITPRVIMAQRNARDAARRAEQEQIEQQRLEQDRRLREEQARTLEDAARRNNAERRATTTAAGGAGHQRGASADMPSPLHTRRRNDPTQPQAAPQTGTPSRVQGQTAPRASRTGASGAQQQYTMPSQAGPSTQPPAGGGSGSGQPPRTSFPHAFERWENLSAQWEGLTSHWIKRMEMNAQSYNDDPIAKQLASQVQDLSAAGANLFHAVVELQRLRASSERKFQRWFFETRSELERANEANAMFQQQVEEVRGQLAQAQNRTSERDSTHSVIQKQLSEMKKELAISKEEARRAWEELGRREQLERERTVALQSGQPITINGMQVVPMTTGANLPSRRGSGREQQQYQAAEYDGGAGPSGAGGYGPEYSQGPPTATTTATSGQGGYYSTGGPGTGQGYNPTGSEGGYSEGEYLIDARGNFVLDDHGNKIPFPGTPSTGPIPDRVADDYDPQTSGPVYTMGSSSDPQLSSAYAPATDYTGSGYGGTWGSQHHHPSRLSDVPEEEESRTSASQVSRA